MPLKLYYMHILHKSKPYFIIAPYPKHPADAIIIDCSDKMNVEFHATLRVQPTAVTIPILTTSYHIILIFNNIDPAPMLPHIRFKLSNKRLCRR